MSFPHDATVAAFGSLLIAAYKHTLEYIPDDVQLSQ